MAEQKDKPASAADADAEQQQVARRTPATAAAFETQATTRPPSEGAQAARDDGPKTIDINTEPDPLAELLGRMGRAGPIVAQIDGRLARRMQMLGKGSEDPSKLTDESFRHDAAYGLQDLEKSPIGKIPVAQELRTELNALAGSAPGLRNDRMIELMKSTAELSDRQLVTDIRNAGRAVGRLENQDTADTRSQVEALENRVRLAKQPEPAAAAELVAAKPADRAAATSAPETKPTAAPEGTNSQVAGRSFAEAVGEPPAAPAQTGPRRQDAADQKGGQATVYNRSIFDTIFDGFRGPANPKGAPWDPPPTPMIDRIEAFNAKTRAEGQDAGIKAAEKSGRAALEALEGFRNNEGATVMARIQEAAKTDPGGMEGVLSEMRDGGRFADLRKEFNMALTHERSAGAAFDKAANALAQYGKDRVGVEPVIAGRPDAASLAARFEKLDAEVGEAAKATPSKTDGQSMFGDLAKGAAELFQKAIDGAKALLSRIAGQDATARPSPSPSPGG